MAAASLNTPTIHDVREAIKRGDKIDAAKMLQAILREQADPDALYLAARLAENRDIALKHLRRALLVDPNHRDSLNLLERMGQTQRGLAHNLGEEIIDTIYEQSDNNPILRRLARWQQLTLVAILATIIIVGFTAVFIMLFSGRETHAVENAMPTPVSVEILSLEDITTHLTATGLTVTEERAADTLRAIPGEIAQLALSNESGQRARISVLMYNSIPAMIGDRANINSHALYNDIMGVSNVIIIYPKTMDRQLVSSLQRAYESMTQN